MLHGGGRLIESVWFGAGNDTRLSYSLENSANASGINVTYMAGELRVLIEAERIGGWAYSNEIGIYDTLELGAGRTLDVIVEKDFACLDGTDAENVDTFPNPNETC